jgi:hypothetical protein
MVKGKKVTGPVTADYRCHRCTAGEQDIYKGTYGVEHQHISAPTTLKVQVQKKSIFLILYNHTMSDMGPVAEAITDKVNNLTVQDVSDQKSDWGTTVDSVLSGDTLTVIKTAPLPQRGRKRQRVDPEAGPSSQSDLSDRYPIETKKPYLACKNLHRKKLSLAFTIARVEEDLNNGRSPQETKLAHRIPGRIAHHPGLKNQWDQVLNDSSNRLAHLYMDKLKEDYIDTKRKINEKMDTLREALEPSQFTEISDSLASNYKKSSQ